MKEPFVILRPRGKRAPLLLSVPHCGVAIPDEVAVGLVPRFVKRPEDTDWFVHELYGFAREQGITMIHARWSRYVIDLNRDPQAKPLYADGRKETALVPVTSFAGEPLYAGPVPDEAEIARRKARYYDPYHAALGALLAEIKEEHGTVALYDAHSIRRLVPTIRPDPFPDLILGDGDGKSADKRVREAALAVLREGEYQVAVNEPFKGGYITRHYGNPANGIHALQLEMSQDLYLDDARDLDPIKVLGLGRLLAATLDAIVTALGRLS